LSAEQQLAALLQVVEEYRAARCREILGVARAQAARTIEQARAKATQRLCASRAAERERRDQAIAAATARLANQRRLLRHRRIASALKTAWTKLETELVARWNSDASRDIWVKHCLAAVPTWLLPDPKGSPSSDPRTAPPDSGLQVEHPPHWAAEERERARSLLGKYGFATVQFMAQPGLSAGLRIRCGHNVLDATVGGLLADRATVEGRLLEHLEGNDP
jgi:hypothetical protein